MAERSMQPSRPGACLSGPQARGLPFDAFFFLWMFGLFGPHLCYDFSGVFGLSLGLRVKGACLLRSGAF